MKKNKIRIVARLFHIVKEYEINNILTQIWEDDCTIDIISVVPHGESEDGMLKYTVAYKKKVN